MGDRPGHPFRGNQWSGGARGGGGRGAATVVKDTGIMDKPSSYFEQAHPGEPETLDQFVIDPNLPPDAPGNITPERAALHKAIEDAHFEGKTPVENPTATIMGGGPASGKSTMEKTMDVDPNTVKIDPDKIRVQFPEWKENVGQPGTNGTRLAMMTHEEASLISKNITKRANAEGYNVLIDGTGDSDYDKLASKLQAHRDAGQRVVGRYATLDTDLAVKLAKAREKITGRGVPEAYQRECHANVSRVVPQAVRNGLFDDFELYDTTIKDKPRKVMSYKNGQTTVHDTVLWSDFIGKGSPPAPKTTISFEAGQG